jgi:hypothetical protein
MNVAVGLLGIGLQIRMVMANVMEIREHGYCYEEVYFSCRYKHNGS